ncbi:MAG TPA: DUF3300 domain-containing protein, partial [Myxococcota bacterium]|nr:DUF3300 domain-containing protein [Myxococcota bacterium]
MRRRARVSLAWLCILACGSTEPVSAQAPEAAPPPPSGSAPASAPAASEPSSKPLSPEELEQLVAPIALYPD